MNLSANLSKLHATICIVAGIILVCQVAVAQTTVTRTMTIDDAGDVLMINEFGGMIIYKDSAVTVEMVMPPDNRPDDYKDLDLRQGDVIRMANGKKLNSTEALRELYETAGIGETIKLAILRDGKMKLRKFLKGDPATLPKPMMMTMITDEVSAGDELALPGAGLMLKSNGGKLVVDALIDNLVPKYDGDSPRKDDTILVIQGNDYTSPQSFMDTYDAIEPGANVTLVLMRKGKKITASFVRPQNMKTRVIKK